MKRSARKQAIISKFFKGSGHVGRRKSLFAKYDHASSGDTSTDEPIESPADERDSKDSVTFVRRGVEDVKFTPLEEQVVKLKERYPGTVLLVECGYKYRFFGQDAQVASDVLNIQCYTDHNFLSACIPTQRLFVHVRRLVSAGHKVGVVKQTETTALKAAGSNRSAPFDRQLTAIYTKSTLLGEDVDCECEDYSPSSFLLCVYEHSDEKTNCGNKQKITILAVQPTTGDLIYDEFEDDSSRSQLESRFLHLDPAEILLPPADHVSVETDRIISNLTALSKNQDDRARIERIPFEWFATPTTTDHKQTSDGVRLCLGAVEKYLTDFGLHGVLTSQSILESYSESRSKNVMNLPGNTLRNLEVLSNQMDNTSDGTLFNIINHTKTRFGHRLLRKWICNPLMDVEDIVARQDGVTECVSGSYPELITKDLQLIFSQCPDLERSLSSILNLRCSPQEFHRTLSCLVNIKSLVVQCCEESIFNLISSTLMRDSIQNVEESLSDVDTYCHVIDEEAAKGGEKTKLFKDLSRFPKLQSRLEQIREVEVELMNHLNDVRDILKTPGLQYTTVSGVEYLLEIKNRQLKHVPADWARVSATKHVTRFRTSFIEETFKLLSRLREQFEAESHEAWLTFLKDFSSNYVRYKHAVRYLAQIDCIFSLAQVATLPGYCRPNVLKYEGKSVIDIKQGKHPTIEDIISKSKGQFVPNNTDLQSDSVRCMLLTGPNMGGKSSYAKQVALLILLAQMGSYIPATSGALTPVDAIYTRMGATDYIHEGRSTFMVELEEASHIMSHATARSLVIIDELGRGTSTHDGTAIAYATLQYFICKIESLVLFITHYLQLNELVELHPRSLAPYHMSYLVDEEGSGSDFVTFLYEVKRGAAMRSYGLNVARLADIPQSILEMAKVAADKLENTKQFECKGELDVARNILLSPNTGISNVIKELLFSSSPSSS